MMTTIDYHKNFHQYHDWNDMTIGPENDNLNNQIKSNQTNITLQNIIVWIRCRMGFAI